MKTPPPGVPVVVLGLMASGKSTVSHLLAGALGRTVRDSDEDLKRAHGLTAARIAERDGADALHRLEAAALADALDAEPPPVIAAAASVIEDPASRERLARDAFVVLLDGPPEVLAERMARGKHRPHFEPDVVAMLRKQRATRMPLFRSVADREFDVSAHGAGEIAAAVLGGTGA